MNQHFNWVVFFCASLGNNSLLIVYFAFVLQVCDEHYGAGGPAITARAAFARQKVQDWDGQWQHRHGAGES